MTKRIFTGNYEECKAGNLISISANRGRSVGYTGKCLMELAPKKVFWNVWKENIGKIPEEENTMFYIREYYKQVLKGLDVLGLLKEEQDPILLCYEKGDAFCHRHVVAEYIEIMYGIKVIDVLVDENGTMTENKRPEYVKAMLIKVMSEEND